MLTVLIGKTASGKDKITNELINKHGFKKIITYTTRPIRKNEKQDVTYHFISTEDFKNKVENGFFAEWKTYHTVQGDWLYGTALEDLENADDNSIIILTPDGYRDVLKLLSNRPTAIYLYANNATIKKRLIERGDSKDEAARRLEHDNIDFKGIENEVDRIVYNNGDSSVEEVVDKILTFMNR